MLMLALTAFLFPLPSRDYPDSAACGQLPQSLLTYIARELPGYEPVPAMSVDTGWRGERPPSDDPSGGPVCLKGDFNGDHLTDFVLFVHKGNTVDLIAFHQSKTGYRHYRAWPRHPLAYKPPLHMAIFRVPPGTLHGGGFGDAPEETVRTTAHSVELVFFETSSVTLYWRNGQYHALWTSD